MKNKTLGALALAGLFAAGGLSADQSSTQAGHTDTPPTPSEPPMALFSKITTTFSLCAREPSTQAPISLIMESSTAPANPTLHGQFSIANPAFRAQVEPLTMIIPALFRRQTQGASTSDIILHDDNPLGPKINTALAELDESLGKTLGFPIHTQWRVTGKFAVGCPPEEVAALPAPGVRI